MFREVLEALDRLGIRDETLVIGVDAYNGREMWNRHIKDVGRFPPTRRGGNIITDGDRVYCVKDLTCYAQLLHMVKRASGETVELQVHDDSRVRKHEVRVGEKPGN